VTGGALGTVRHARATYLQSWGGPDTPLLWRFQGDVAGSGAHGDLNAHIIDMVRFVTGEEITTVEGSIEHTFITERDIIDGGAGGEIAGAGAATGGTKGTTTPTGSRSTAIAVRCASTSSG
jgi:predicted dehydrogenase